MKKKKNDEKHNENLKNLEYKDQKMIQYERQKKHTPNIITENLIYYHHNNLSASVFPR